MCVKYYIEITPSRSANLELTASLLMVPTSVLQPMTMMARFVYVTTATVLQPAVTHASRPVSLATSLAAPIKTPTGLVVSGTLCTPTVSLMKIIAQSVW